MKKIHGLFLAAGASALLLAACGSSDNDSPAPAPTPTATTDIPTSATTDSAGLLTYVNAQAGTSSDTGEPILVGDAVLPVDNTTETSL